MQFTPASAGTLTGALTITSNSQVSPQTVPLDGIGIVSTPVVTLSPSQLSLPAQAAGTISPPQPVTLQNTGSAPLALSSVAANGAAAETNNCPTILATGSSCIINVMLAAPLTGACSGSITIDSNAPGGPQSISISGGCLPLPSIESALSSSSLVFTPQTVATLSPSQTVNLTNIGSAPLNIASITAVGDAVQTNNCGAVLAVASSCSINVAFAPSAIGPRTAAVIVTDAAPDSPHVISISGLGLPNPVPIVNQPLLPAAIRPGAAGLTLVVNGSGFVPGSVVYWNGSPRVTQSISGLQLSTSLTAADLATPGTGSVSVVNPAPGGGPSNAVWLPVAYPSPAPVLTVATIPTGMAPSSLIAADFNQDGKLDLAVTNSGANTVSILLGHGDGTFAAAVNYSTGNLPMAIATGDFNHDGIPDLAIVNQADNTVSILLGTGGGAFSSGATYATGTQPAAVVAADLNADGNPDLAIANQADDTVSILLGDGDGAFAPQLAYPAGESPDALIAADFDGDGKPDLAIGNDVTPGGTVTVLLNHGDGSYLPGVTYATGDSVSLVAADLNGDGKLDFAAVNYLAQSLSVYLGTGKGTFTLGPTQTTRLSPNLTGLAAADINADGTLELLMGGNADAGFTAVSNNDAGTFTSILQTGAVSQTTALAVGDFNNDGSIDAALASYGSNTISILLQSPALAVSSSNVSFGNVVVGANGTQTVTLTNSGSAMLQIGTVTASGAFSQTNNCSAAIAPGNGCTIMLVFSPPAAGTQNGVLSIASNISGPPQTVNLVGAGVTFAATVGRSQSSVIGGNPLTSNTITLSSPAPQSGWSVELSSSNSAIASVPGAVSVAPGAAVSSSFTITTAAVSSSTPVTVSANINGYTATAILTVNPMGASVILSSTSVTGGALVTSNSITLASPAPVGGLLFNLVSSNPALASVPATVTVAAGATATPSFNIQTTAIGSNTTVTIFASLSGVPGAIANATLKLLAAEVSSLTLTSNAITAANPRHLTS